MQRRTLQPRRMPNAAPSGRASEHPLTALAAWCYTSACCRHKLALENVLDAQFGLLRLWLLSRKFSFFPLDALPEGLVTGFHSQRGMVLSAEICSWHSTSDYCISRYLCLCGRGRLAGEAVRGRVEVALEAMGGLLAAVRLPAHALGPLLRACAQALTVDGLHVLQVKAVGARPPLTGRRGGSLH